MSISPGRIEPLLSTPQGYSIKLPDLLSPSPCYLGNTFDNVLHELTQASTVLSPTSLINHISSYLPLSLDNVLTAYACWNHSQQASYFITKTNQLLNYANYTINPHQALSQIYQMSIILGRIESHRTSRQGYPTMLRATLPPTLFYQVILLYQGNPHLTSIITQHITPIGSLNVPASNSPLKSIYLCGTVNRTSQPLLLHVIFYY